MAHDELVKRCETCAKLSPSMEQAAASLAAQIGNAMCCRECGRPYETSAQIIEQQAAEIERLTCIEDALGLAAIQMQEQVEQQAARIAKLEREKAVVDDLLEQQQDLAMQYLTDCNEAVTRIAKLEAALKLALNTHDASYSWESIARAALESKQ